MSNHPSNHLTVKNTAFKNSNGHVTKAKLQGSVRPEGWSLLPQQHRHPSRLQHSTAGSLYSSHLARDDGEKPRRCAGGTRAEERGKNNPSAIRLHPIRTETRTHLCSDVSHRNAKVQKTYKGLCCKKCIAPYCKKREDKKIQLGKHKMYLN